MIQRIQSLFLLAIVVLSAILLLLPVYVVQSNTGNDMTGIAPSHTIQLSSNTLLLILNCVIGFFALIAIFLYKNRNLQIRLCNLAMLITCGFIGLLIFAADSISSGMNQVIHYSFGTYLPMLEVILFFLAARQIKKDEELVRSADRLR